MTTPKAKKTKSLIVTPIEVTANGETFQIKPFSFAQLPYVTGKLFPVFSSLEQVGETVSLETLVVAGGENLMQVLAVAIGKPREWLDELRGEVGYVEGRALMEAVYEANKDLLTKKLIPDLMALMAGMTKDKAQAEANA